MALVVKLLQWWHGNAVRGNGLALIEFSNSSQLYEECNTCKFVRIPVQRYSDALYEVATFLRAAVCRFNNMSILRTSEKLLGIAEFYFEGGKEKTFTPVLEDFDFYYAKWRCLCRPVTRALVRN